MRKLKKQSNKLTSVQAYSCICIYSTNSCSCKCNCNATQGNSSSDSSGRAIGDSDKNTYDSNVMFVM